MKKLIAEKLYTAAYWNGKNYIIIKASINTKKENTIKWIEENFDWIKDKEYIIAEYLAR